MLGMGMGRAIERATTRRGDEVIRPLVAEFDALVAAALPSL